MLSQQRVAGRVACAEPALKDHRHEIDEAEREAFGFGVGEADGRHDLSWSLSLLIMCSMLGNWEWDGRMQGARVLMLLQMLKGVSGSSRERALSRNREGLVQTHVIMQHCHFHLDFTYQFAIR